MSTPISNTHLASSLNVEQLFTDALNQLENIKGALLDEGIPDTKNTPAANPDIPSLPLPATGGLSLETLINAIGFEQRRTSCKAGIESIEAKAQQQQNANEKQLQEIAEQLEKMDKQKVLNIFKKVFSVIGAIIGAVASAATIAAGALTGNPLLVVAGAIGMFMAMDSAISVAFDGQVGFAATCASICTSLGLSEETAQKVAMGLQLALTAVTIALSFGAGFASGASGISSAANTASEAVNIVNTAQKGLNIANGVLTTAQGATTIANSVIQYQVDLSKLTQKELEAILERIRQAIEMEKSLIESEMERSNDLLEKVHDIVQDKNAAQQAILTGMPNFA